MLSHKLPVSEQAVDGLTTEQSEVSFEQMDSFLRVRRALFRQHAEQQRGGHALVLPTD